MISIYFRLSSTPVRAILIASSSECCRLLSLVIDTVPECVLLTIYPPGSSVRLVRERKNDTWNKLKVGA